ncbi:MAG: hypothetical protein C0603_08550 [Denitrovibrio sp.]|nr:MAG: hypothetical protein C0603_08550 [Denitrovibrio sp.]
MTNNSTNAKTLLNEVEQIYSEKEIISYAKKINKIYNLLSSDILIWQDLKNIFGTNSYALFDKYSSQFVANKFINELFLKYHINEKILKYMLVKDLISKDETVVFEMNTLNSRVDICRINGQSYAYEIKSEYDSLKRLGKQLSDYSKLFEFVFVIVTVKHLEEAQLIIPLHCGIILYKDGKLRTIKKATKSPLISPKEQLSHIHPSKFKYNFTYPYDGDESSKALEAILTKYTNKTINTRFKKILKSKYKEEWKFVRDNYTNILPIDVEAFFQTTLSPELVYSKKA